MCKKVSSWGGGTLNSILEKMYEDNTKDNSIKTILFRVL